jgi:hypothetical protein
LEHTQSQFRLGGKADGLGNVSGSPAGRILAPVLGQIQFTINEGVSQGGDIADKDADLTIFHPAGDATILRPHPGGVLAAFGQATFIEGQHREELVGRSLLGQDGRRLQGLLDHGTQFIANPVLVPDRSREQALHAVGPQLPGMLSNLPAIFTWNLREDRLQVEQGYLVGLGTGKVGTQPLMQLLQAQGPACNLSQACPG